MKSAEQLTSRKFSLLCLFVPDLFQVEQFAESKISAFRAFELLRNQLTLHAGWNGRHKCSQKKNRFSIEFISQIEEILTGMELRRRTGGDLPFQSASLRLSGVCHIFSDESWLKMASAVVLRKSAALIEKIM